MKSIGIFYGTTTGTTAEVAKQIGKELKVADSDIHNVTESAPTDTAPYQVLLLGTSTWGAGDLQEDMEDFVDGLQALDLSGKLIGIFGCGDESMTDTFCNGVGILYDRLKDTGASFVGAFNADGYDFGHSDAEKNGRIVGLLLDQVNRPEATPGRIDEWATIIYNAAQD